MTAMKPRRRANPWVRLLLSLMVCATVAVPLAVLLMPAVVRWHTLNHLTSDDATARNRALNYVIQHAGSDATTRRRAIEALATADLPTALQLHTALTRAGVTDDPALREALATQLMRVDDAGFYALHRLMDLAGQWTRERVPDDPWLRWLQLLAAANDPAARLLAVDRLGEGATLATDHRARIILTTLATDPDPGVRMGTLIAAARLSTTVTSTAQVRFFHDLFIEATHDASPDVARRAFILVGLVHPMSGFRVAWDRLDPSVAEAAAWAVMRTNPDQPDAVIRLLNDPLAPPRVRAAAAYALGTSHAASAHQALLTFIAAHHASPPDDLLPVLVRAVLGVRLDLAGPDAGGVLPDTHSYAAGDLPRREPVLLAVTHRLPDLRPAAELDRLLQVDRDPLPGGPLATLAILEAMPADSVTVPPAADLPDLIRLALARVTASPSSDLLAPVFEHPRAAARDLACLAALRLERDELDALIARLIRSYNDDAKTAGAILSGFTGLQTSLLAKRTALEDVWAVKQIMELGLWMQGQPLTDGADGAQRAAALLTRDDLPRTTIMLAMLHRGDLIALDYLLSPTEPPAADLQQLLDQHRWWLVLQPFLADDAPTLWLWADESLISFQIEVLRNWYLLNRPTALRPDHDKLYERAHHAQ